MNLFRFVERIQEAHGINKQHEFPQYDMNPLDALFLFNTDREVGKRDLLLARVYENLIWLYRCVRLAAESIASVPIRVYDANNKEITERPEFRIFHRPNPYQTKFDFFMESISRLLLQGELFWYKERPEGSRKIVALYADWRSEEITVVPDPEGYIKGFIRIVNGKKSEIPKDDVFFVKLFNPYSAYRGLSPVRVGKHINELELSAVLYNKKFFSEGIKSPGVFSTDKELDEKQAKKLKKQLMERLGGLENMWEPTVLWGGLKFQALNNMSLRDAEFSVLRKMNREDIAGLYSTPPELLGFGKDTYENVKEARKMYWTDALIPLLTKLQDLINVFLIPELVQYNARLEFDLSEVEALKEGEDSLLSRYVKGFEKGAITPNEIRKFVFGLDPIEDPTMNSTYLPANVIPAGELKESKKGYEELDTDEL